MIVNIPDDSLKANLGHNKIVYDIDYLLDHLSREIYLLECYRRAPKPLKTIDDIKKEMEKGIL